MNLENELKFFNPLSSSPHTLNLLHLLTLSFTPTERVRTGHGNRGRTGTSRDVVFVSSSTTSTSFSFTLSFLSTFGTVTSAQSIACKLTVESHAASAFRTHRGDNPCSKVSTPTLSRRRRTHRRLPRRRNAKNR